MERENRNRIMIVDDSDINRQILTEMLKDIYDIVEARDGHEAIHALRGSESIDLILLDIFMPDMDGYEVLTLMNKYHWIEHTPVMMISAFQDTADMEWAYQLGATDFIRRPFDRTIITHRISNTLKLHDKQRRLADLVERQVYDLESHRALTFANDSVRSTSRQELDEMVFQLRKVFDIVRLVDARGGEISLTGEKMCARGGCYAVWNREKRCEDCVSAMALRERSKRTKLVLKGDELYQVIAKYVKVDGAPYVMEMVQKVSGELMLDSAGQNNFMNEISRYNRMLYIDPVTETYNRRYYEQCAKQMTDIRAVAMLDGDRFKDINDTYGHAAGDEALLVIAKAIQSCIRTTDQLIRYGGDEFILLMPDIPEEIVRRKLEFIAERVQSAVLPGCPEAVLAVTIGATYQEGVVADLIHAADRAMYEGKRTGKSIMLN